MMNLGNNFTNYDSMSFKSKRMVNKRILSTDQAQNLVRQNYNLYNQGLISSQECIKFMKQILKRAGIEENYLTHTRY